jgi:hypothetical protein
VHHRAFFDLGRAGAGRTAEGTPDLLDHQLHVGSGALVVQDPNVFETHQGLDDLARVSDDVGASALLPHNTKREAPSSRLGGSQLPGSPRQNPKSRNTGTLCSKALDRPRRGARRVQLEGAEVTDAEPAVGGRLRATKVQSLGLIGRSLSRTNRPISSGLNNAEPGLVEHPKSVIRVASTVTSTSLEVASDNLAECDESPASR